MRCFILNVFVFLLLPLALYAQLTYSSVITDALCGCNGTASVTITSGVAPYSYTLNGVPTSTNAFTNLCAGAYTLFVKDSNAPTPDTVSVFFTIADNTFTSNIQAKDGCNTLASASISLTGGVAPYSYTIFPIGVAQSLTLSNLSAGTYTFAAKDNAGCAITNTFAVNNYSAIANFSMSASNAKPGTTIYFTNTSQYASSYLWDFGNGNTSVTHDAAETYTVPGTYKVKLIAYMGTCSDTSFKWVVITDKLWISIPNVFTPNDDAVNDLWIIHSEGATNMNVQIFNRYGVKIYENTGTGVQWDGRTMSGEAVPTGTYFYSLEVTDVLGNINKYSGYISLIR